MTTFYKYQGTGNDFIMIDNRDKKVSPDLLVIKKMCDRRFGIGADGLILLENATGFDFSMVYFNSDGAESTMCGNGGRCITAFALFLGIIKDKARFKAIDGEHDAIILEQKDNSALISLKMKNVTSVERVGTDYVLDTGSPHFVRFVDNVSAVNVFTEGRKIRESERFAAKGINVNFVEFKDGLLNVRTYERGVEDETLSCGTGVTASALALSAAGLVNGQDECNILVPGGELKVKFKTHDGEFSDIWLEGPADFVFKGELKI